VAREWLAVFCKSGLVIAPKSVTLDGKRFPAHLWAAFIEFRLWAVDIDD